GGALGKRRWQRFGNHLTVAAATHDDQAGWLPLDSDILAGDGGFAGSFVHQGTHRVCAVEPAEGRLDKGRIDALPLARLLLIVDRFKFLDGGIGVATHIVGGAVSRTHRWYFG